LKDPVTNKYLSNYQIIIVRKPNNGFSSVCIDLPTEISIDTGVNEQGVVISYTGLTTDNKTNKGIPWGLRQVMVMDHASSAEEAIDIINSNKTIGWSFIIGDSKTPIGYAIEQNANYSYAGTWDNPVENNYPSWTIDHMVRRGNLYLDPISAGIDPGIYKNSTLLRWLLLKFQILNETNYYPAKKHFITLSKTYHCNHGKLNLQNSMKLLRLFYRGWTEPLFFFLQKLPRWYYRNNWHQSVICPETGDILVSFSHNQRSAHKCRIHHFNMYDLFDSKKNNY